MAVAYASGLLLLLQNPFWQRMLLPLAFYGRMALTNYLLQSFLLAFLFSGYGWGLVGKVSIWQGQLMALAIHAVLIMGSYLWLGYFSYGPLEWVWRLFTYMRRCGELLEKSYTRPTLLAVGHLKVASLQVNRLRFNLILLGEGKLN